MQILTHLSLLEGQYQVHRTWHIPEENRSYSCEVVGLRRRISEQMSLSKSRIPHFSYFEEVDITELENLRQILNSTRDENQPKLPYLPFIMLALAKIMPDHPECNAHFDDEAGVVNRNAAVNLGIATQTDRGLYVPVVKHVESWTSGKRLLKCRGSLALRETGVQAG